MKNLVVILLTVLLVSVSLTGCKGLIKGSGEIETKDFTFTDFSEVKADDGFDVDIVYGASYNITINADNNLLDYVQVLKKDDTLKLSLKRGDYIDANVKAVVTMPHLRSLTLSGAAICSVAGFDTRAGVRFSLYGDSSLTLEDMMVGDLTLDVLEAGEATGNITAGDVCLKADNGSTVQLTGEANDLICEGAGSSMIKLEDFTVRNADIRLGGESIAAIKPEGKLDVDLKKGSSLAYYGNPVLGATRISDDSTMARK